MAEAAHRKIDLESIVRSLVPTGEALLWIGESDSRLLRRRNWIGFGSLLATIPIALAISAGLLGLAIYAHDFLPSNKFGDVSGYVIFYTGAFATILPIMWAVAVALRLGLEDRLGARAVVTGITEERIIVATGPGTMHQRICIRGTFQQMRIQNRGDDVACFKLFSNSKNVPELHIRYVHPANQIAQLLQLQLAPTPINTEQPIAGGTAP